MTFRKTASHARAARILSLALLLCVLLNTFCLGFALAESDAMRAAHEAGPQVKGILEAGPDIALYVAQGGDNDFYLTHDVSGAMNANGAAFLDCRCSLEPRSQHIMIHGHNMKSGAVFGNLDKFKDPEFVKANPIFYWTTDAGVEVYVPYAIATISVDFGDAHFFDMTRWDFSDDQSFQDFTGGLIAKSLMTLPVDVKPGDSLLSLVTCGYEYDDGRLVVALRKLRDDETEPGAFKLFLENM